MANHRSVLIRDTIRLAQAANAHDARTFERATEGVSAEHREKIDKEKMATQYGRPLAVPDAKAEGSMPCWVPRVTEILQSTESYQSKLDGRKLHDQHSKRYALMFHDPAFDAD